MRRILLMLALIALIAIPAYAVPYEEHSSGTWTSNGYNDTGYPPSNLKTGGKWQFSSGPATGHGICYDLGGTPTRGLVGYSMKWTATLTSATSFYVTGSNTSCLGGGTIETKSITSGAGGNLFNSTFAQQNFRYIRFAEGGAGSGATFRSAENVLLYWDSTILDAAFTASPSTGLTAPVSVTFTDTSTGPKPDAYYWNISVSGADIYSSNARNVTYTFNDGGVYSVTLRITNSTASDSVTQTYSVASPATVNTYFQCVDGQDSSSIYGCNLAIKDETYNYWANSTADADGTHFIVSNTTDTLAGYATATGFQSTSRTGLAAWSEGLYELIMWPDDSVCTTPGFCGTAYDPGLGNVNLIIMVNDKDTSDPIADADIKFIKEDGTTSYGVTNDAGTYMAFFSNKTQVRIVASKTGYTGASKIYTTSDFGPDTVRLELSKAYVTVTPTVTITDGSGNPVETIDTRTDAERDQALFNKLRDNAPTLIDLCILGITAYILMSILGLFGVKFN